MPVVPARLVPARLVLARLLFAALLLAPAGAGAQQAPTPAHPPAQGSAAVRPTVKPAPRTPVQSAPLVQARPGGTGHKPHPTRPNNRPGAKPAAKPTPKPVIPAVVPVPTPQPEPEKQADAKPGPPSNVPRFATLRSDDVNLRSGPGTRYPIEWVYKRRDLPVMIERDFDIWRLVVDPEGIKGWVHAATLAPRRTGVVINGEHTLRHDPKDDATPVARLKPGVIVRLRSCEAGADWCQASAQDYRGWIKRSDIWGTLPGEAIQ